MTTSTKFEDYLKEVFSEDYMGTKDDIEDRFNDWLAKLDTNQLMTYGESYVESLLAICRARIEHCQQLMGEIIEILK